MSSITCGNCHSTHSDVTEVKACYQSAGRQKPATFGFGGDVGIKTLDAPVVAVIRRAQSSVPDSKYALANLAGHANEVTFFDVHTGKKNTKWEGFQFVTRLVGAPGSFREYPVKGDARKIILRKIADGPRDAALRFSREFTVCAACGAPLTDDDSRARGFGPVCAEKF